MDNKIKKILFLFFFTILLLPITEQSLPFFTSKRLDGYFTNATDIEFTFQKWWDEVYQKQKNNFLNDHVGFRPELLRLNNQIDYSLFAKIHSGTIVEGTNNCLYQDILINAYYGRDYVGYDALKIKITKLKKLQDTMQHLGKSLTLIYAPCKAFFYPEFFPEKLKGKPNEGTNNNYKTLLHLGDSLGINQIDFNAWFVSLKNRSKEMLFSKQGFHWTVYGSLIAADSLSKYIEQKTHKHLPRPVWNKLVYTTEPRATDNDIAKCMDIIFPVVKENYTYPEVTYPLDLSMTKTKMIYIGDSYLVTWIYDKYMDNTNCDWQLWYYFRIVWDKLLPYEDQQHQFIAEYDWLTAMKNTDNIVIMYTSRNLSSLGDGFIEKAYDYYYPNK